MFEAADEDCVAELNPAMSGKRMSNDPEDELGPDASRRAGGMDRKRAHEAAVVRPGEKRNGISGGDNGGDRTIAVGWSNATPGAALTGNRDYLVEGMSAEQPASVQFEGEASQERDKPATARRLKITPRGLVACARLEWPKRVGFDEQPAFDQSAEAPAVLRLLPTRRERKKGVVDRLRKSEIAIGFDVEEHNPTSAVTPVKVSAQT